MKSAYLREEVITNPSVFLYYKQFTKQNIATNT